MTRWEGTLAREVSFSGVGIHGGQPARCTVSPAPAGTGRRFILGGQEVPASLESVVRVDRCTVLGRGGREVSTVEHLLSAAAALELDNLLIEVEGPELPILDGSAAPFLSALQGAGRIELDRPARSLTLPWPVWVAEGEALALALPARELSYEVAVHYPHPLVGQQSVRFDPSRGGYAEEVAPARTFGFWEEVEGLLARGLGLGGALGNALVIGGEGGFSSPPRFPDEPVRHKLLDLIGDLALLGADLKARVVAVRAGHRLHVALGARILEEVGRARRDGSAALAPPALPVPDAGPGPGAG